MHSWTTPDQLKFLRARRKTFRDNQAEGTISDFWNSVLDEWRAKYPSETTYGDGKPIIDRLMAWFYNHGKETDGDELEGGAASRTNMLNLGKRSRKLSILQMYQKKYYRVKWAVKCKASWKAYKASDEDAGHKKKQITFINERCQEYLNEESAMVQKEIDILMQRQAKGEVFLWEDEDLLEGDDAEKGKEAAQNGDAEAAREAADEKTERIRFTLETWDQNIKQLPKALVDLVKEVQQKTGFAATMLLGGPVPGDIGEISTVCVDAEVGKKRLTFRKMNDKYATQIEGDFVKYLHKVFPVEERARRSLERLNQAGPATTTAATTKDITMTSDAEMSMVEPSATPANTATAVNTSASGVPTGPATATGPASTVPVTSVAGLPDNFKVGPPKGKKKSQPATGNATPAKVSAALENVDKGPVDGSETRTSEGQGKEPGRPGTTSGGEGDVEAVTGSRGESVVPKEKPTEGNTKSLVTEGGGAQEPVPKEGEGHSQQLVVEGGEDAEGVAEQGGEARKTLTMGMDRETKGRSPTSSPKRSTKPKPRVITRGPQEPNTLRALRWMDEGYTAEDEESSTHETHEPTTDDDTASLGVLDDDRVVMNKAVPSAAVAKSVLRAEGGEPESERAETTGQSVADTTSALGTQTTSVGASSPNNTLPVNGVVSQQPHPFDSLASDHSAGPNIIPDVVRQIRPNPFYPDPLVDEAPYVTQVVRFLNKLATDKDEARPDLHLQELREDFEDIVSQWAGVDRRMGYPAALAKGHQFSAKGRPEQVGWWISRGRKYERAPEIEDVKEYGAKVRTWWRYNQPLWRYEDCDEDWPLVRHAPPLEDWKEVAKGGANGLLMVMVALGWWFENVGDKTDVAELSSVIEDVRWVLHEIKTGIEEGPVLDMLVARGGTTKHGREESDDKGKERKQKKRHVSRK